MKTTEQAILSKHLWYLLHEGGDLAVGAIRIISFFVCFSDTRRQAKGFTISLCFHFLTRFLDLPITCPLWMRYPLQARPFQARHWASLVIATSEHMGLHRPPFIASISCSAPSTWASCIGVTAPISTLLFFKIFKPKESVG